MITLTPSQIPPALLQLPQLPAQLCLSHDRLVTLLAQPRLAIVGSRKVSPYGRAVTTKFASDLAGKGVVVVSGLALGVDSLAHAMAVQAGTPTIAVLPTGLDRIYPTSHHNLARSITEKGGLLVSEYPERTEPMRHNFIARNRIIAALAEGVLITEAAVNSGSLHTARFALELGIPVLAVPGPITSPTSEGTNNLIKAGAVPVTSVDDIIAALNWKLENAASHEVYANSEPERIILELLRAGQSDGSELLLASSLPAASFNQALTMLELTGRIRPLGNNHWSLS